MSAYLVIASIPCQLADAEFILNDLLFKLGRFEHAANYQDASTIRNAFAKWLKIDNILIFERAEIEAFLNGGKDERCH